MLYIFTGQKTGGLAVLKRKERYIYYLITKTRYFHKPTYDTLRSSLEAMKKHSVDNKVSDIAMPMIGCGLDKLRWGQVHQILTEVFSDTDVNITVYSL